MATVTTNSALIDISRSLEKLVEQLERQNKLIESILTVLKVS